MKKTLSFISIIGIAAFAGNMINIGLSYAIHWQSLDPIRFMETFKVDFPLLLGPTAITLLPAFITTLWLAFLEKNNKSARRYWFFAFAGLLIINIQTATYHLPMNLDFMELKYSSAEAASKLHVWVFSHWVRIAVALCSAVFALKASQLSNNNNPNK